jgi:hypothetical protein
VALQVESAKKNRQALQPAVSLAQRPQASLETN